MELEEERAVALAEEARRVVAAQVTELVVAGRRTGSEGVLAHRLRALVIARESRDPAVLRAALVDVSVAAASWAVHLDVAARR